MFFLLVGAAIAVAGVFTYEDLAQTVTVVTATDTNRVSGTVYLPVVNLDQGRNQTRYDGAYVQVYASNVKNDSDNAFGNLDTVILTYRALIKNVKQTLKTDTMALVPETSYVWITADTLMKLMDGFEVGYYIADSTEDYSQTGQITTCTLKTDIRLWKE